ncbi:hypothetical protein E9229_002772 [Paeniglutamicibacter cryotolerans]|uniref:Uncharacterized protein n=1 Tax=Paeniglutamicibacter cryotolerans TaxID=670079 RepID=A0A839QPF8_9MICC|nr:hypothetical protein [Paeniglutamicibacter cryotolerans]
MGTLGSPRVRFFAAGRVAGEPAVRVFKALSERVESTGSAGT